MSSPLVSVCVTSYNHEKYVRAAVESVQSQTVADWEMIVIDDGSSDGTLDSLKDICDDRISVEGFSSNKTRCVALNQCLSRARGRYIAILNSDDLWHPRKLEKQLNAFDGHSSLGAVFSWVKTIDDEGSDLGENGFFHKTNQSSHEWLKYLITNSTPFCHASALIRREVYDHVGYYDERLTQLLDFEQWIRVCEDFEVWVVPEILTSERRLSDRSNVSGDRPDVYARTHWERSLALWKALRRNHPSLRSALADLQSVDHSSSSRLLDSESERTHPTMEAIVLNLLIDESIRDIYKAQSLKIAAALYLFESFPANQPGFPPSEKPKLYHQWIRELDPLRYTSLSEICRLEGVERQLERIQRSLSWRLSSPLRRAFWTR